MKISGFITFSFDDILVLLGESIVLNIKADEGNVGNYMNIDDASNKFNNILTKVIFPH